MTGDKTKSIFDYAPLGIYGQYGSGGDQRVIVLSHEIQDLEDQRRRGSGSNPDFIDTVERLKAALLKEEFKKPLDAGRLAALLRFETRLEQYSNEIRDTTPFGNSVFSAGYSSSTVLEKHQGDLAKTFAAASPEAAKDAVVELFAFSRRAQHRMFGSPNYGDLRRGITALGAAIASGNSWSVETITSSGFNALQEAVHFLRERRDNPFYTAIWISREEALRQRSQPVKVFGKIWENGKVVREYNGEPYNENQHNTDQLGFQTQCIDENGEPMRKLAADMLTGIAARHPWTIDMALGETVEYETAVEAPRAAAAKAAKAATVIQPIVIIPTSPPAHPVEQAPVSQAPRRGWLAAAGEAISAFRAARRDGRAATPTPSGARPA